MNIQNSRRLKLFLIRESIFGLERRQSYLVKKIVFLIDCFLIDMHIS